MRTQLFDSLSDADLAFSPGGQAVASHVDHLKTWFQTLNNEMQTAITTFLEEDRERTIDRGGPVTIEFQLDAYLQAVLIFLGKATIYLRVMSRQLPSFFQEYIG